MTTYETIKLAIQNKQTISADYDRLPRLLCPHVIGTKNGIQQCLCYQYGGQTSQGPITADTAKNWKCLVISKLSNVVVTTDSWHTFDNHSQKQTCVDHIDVEVAY